MENQMASAEEYAPLVDIYTKENGRMVNSMDGEERFQVVDLVSAPQAGSKTDG